VSCLRVVFAILFGGVLLAQSASAPEVLFKAALQSEQVDQDREKAARQYRALIDAHPRHELAARAWLQLAGMFEQQGRLADAREAYGRLLKGFPNLTALVAQATTRRQQLESGPVDRHLAWPASFGQAADAGVDAIGRFVSYIDMAGPRDLFVRDLQSNQARRLTRIAEEGGFVEYSVVSPNGRHVAFSASQKGETHQGLRILPLAATLSTPARVLLGNAYVVPRDWTSDSRSVLGLISHLENRRTVRRQLALIEIQNGSTRVLAEWPGTSLAPSVESIIRLSPDGHFVGLHLRRSSDNPQTDLHVISTASGAVVPLLEESSDERFVGWAPDGRFVVFLSNREGTRDLWALPVTNGKRAGDPTLLVRGFDGGPIGLTNTGALLYERSYENRAMFVAGVDPEGGRLVESPRAWVPDPRARAPRWSKDGASFAYLLEGQIAIRSVATGITRTLPLRLGYKWTYDWAPDARKMVFRANGVDGVQGVYLFDVETADIRRIAHAQAAAVGYYFPQFSAAGEAIGYCREYFANGPEPGVSAVVHRSLVTDAETVVLRSSRAEAGKVVLVNAKAPRSGCGISPDGRYMARLGPGSVLSVTDLSSGEGREVFRSTAPNAFSARDGIHWMPDSRALVANVIGGKPGAPRAIWWIPIDGRPAHPIDIGLQTLVDDAIAIHPSGRQVAFVAGDPVASKTSGPKRELRVLERFLTRQSR
jgi:Tol biopolymer transport system component